jgi:transcriptional regulator of acetoin/glycerol metabolism
MADGRCTHHHMLLEGSEAATQAALRSLHPHLGEPVSWRRPGSPFEVPSGQVGALILEDVGDLDADEQARLLRWLDGTSPCTRIVSTSADSLFARVGRGRFDAELYYRLNIVLLQID